MPSQRTIRLVRRALLLVLVGFAGGIALLLWFGQRRPQDPLLARDRTTEPGDLEVDVSTGFDYTISVGGRNLMRVRADRVISRAGREVHLEQIGPIELYRTDGETIFVRADRGSIDIESGGASLIGNVELQGPDGTSFLTEQMDLEGDGKVVRSQGVVRLGKGEEMVGRANRFVADLKQDTIQLVGRVKFTVRGVDGGPDYQLGGRRVTYHPGQRQAQFAGGVTLVHGSARMQAREMTALGSEGGGLSQVSFRRGVNGDWNEPGTAARPVQVHMRAQDLDLDFDAGGDLVESRLRRSRPAELILDQGDVRQSLRGVHIDLQWNQGEPVSGTARTSAQIVESSPDGGRSAVSDVIDFGFAGGVLTAVTMQGNVRVQEADGTTTGDRATYRANSRSFRVTGDPAMTTFPTGSLTSPEIVYNGESRTASAVSPVRGEFQRGSEPGVMSGEAPSKFSAQEATWEQDRAVVTLRGEARMWQARDLLVADRIASNLAQRSAEASGDVRVILEQQEAGRDGAPVRVEAASDAMTYDERERIIHMTGNATAQRDGRTLSCTDLDVILSPAGEAERMHCSGGTRLFDPIAGRTVTGDETVYEIAAREARFTGDPVVVEGDDGSRVTGLRLRYLLDQGDAIMDLGDQPPGTDGEVIIIEPEAPANSLDQVGAAPPAEVIVIDDQVEGLDVTGAEDD